MTIAGKMSRRQPRTTNFPESSLQLVPFSIDKSCRPQSCHSPRPPPTPHATLPPAAGAHLDHGTELVMVKLPSENRGDVPLPIATHANHAPPISPFHIPQRASGPLPMPCHASPRSPKLMPRRCSIPGPIFSRLELPNGLTSTSSPADPFGRRPGPVAGGARDIFAAASASLPPSDILPYLDRSLQTWILSSHFSLICSLTVP
ncbi:hypothetical protein B0T11DRAFT_54801 [Plectosphaerella cucumerina]|uniref:Uncharacterized protein n=1 Tax=Plectosphaerella cucumerina TaxID=40658 RepID=A0A8K0X5Q4_9PEZI|nr:hypothetical protein B0T11DRAFT_54801 [Plectosphaerella cucumerina]